VNELDGQRTELHHMHVRAQLNELSGEWTGVNRLWFSPDEPVRQSESTASITLAARDTCAIIRYTWADEGKPHEGVLMVRVAAKSSDIDVVWTDSWHMSHQFMVCRREDDSQGRVSARGSYAAPPGPDWGWRIVVASDAAEHLQIVMYNISPDGDEMLAVDATYSRAT